ncbi:MAG: dTMP kinase, partial [Okeania sp. SIO2G5]|nr:dTMP kinase [Okeania sp. SIO2G5]
MVGRLIVFEGIEGCGKTTQLRSLQRWLSQPQIMARLHPHVDKVSSPNILT